MGGSDFEKKVKIIEFEQYLPNLLVNLVWKKIKLYFHILLLEIIILDEKNSIKTIFHETSASMGKSEPKLET